MRSAPKLLVLICSLVFSAALMTGTAGAVTSATIVFDYLGDAGDNADGPQYDIVGAGPVDDGSGCDQVIVIIVDATNTPTDIDQPCLNLGTGEASDDGDYGTLSGGYFPLYNPVTYRVYDVDAAEYAALSGLADDAYVAYVLANGTFLAAASLDHPGLPYLPVPVGPAAAPVPGPDMVYIPDTAVVGSFVATTPVHYAPLSDAVSTTVMEAGKTAWVYGVDESGEFYKVMLAGKFFWVPVATMGPNYDSVWNGRPLPTVVVN